MGWSWNVVIVQPGPFHSECRTIFKRAIGLNEVARHDPLIQEEAKNLLDKLEVLRGDPWETVQGYATSSFNLAAPMILRIHLFSPISQITDHIDPIDVLVVLSFALLMATAFIRYMATNSFDSMQRRWT
jgi:hypothetical protein